MDVNEADTEPAEKLRIWPGVRAHSVDIPIEMQGAAADIPKTSVPSYTPVIAKFDIETTRALNADAGMDIEEGDP